MNEHHDDDVLRQTVARLLLPIAWLLATGRRYSIKELAVKVMESLRGCAQTPQAA
jgi:hypothetical protein